MRLTITRLALFQCLAVFYSVLFVGLIVKVRFSSPAPPIFATYLRDYGFVLLVVPMIWLLWACLSADRPLPGAGEFGPILGSGLGLLGLLIFVAFIGTMSAILPGSTVQIITPPPPLTDSP
jgi:hypothetical protein